MEVDLGLVKFGGNKSIGVDNKGNEYRVTEGGVDALDSIGFSASLKNYNYGHENPFEPFFNLVGDEDTVLETTVGVTKEIDQLTDYKNEYNGDSEFFIGFEFGVYLFSGFKIKVGFNV